MDHSGDADATTGGVAGVVHAEGSVATRSA
jgi:hypothetical protein